LHIASGQTVLSDLRDTTHQVTYLIIAPSQYVSTIQPLADFRTSHNSFSAGIAVTDSIYASFGAGTSPDTAIKQFIQYTFSSWEEPLPEFILLAGTVNTVPSHRERGIQHGQDVLEDSICVDHWFIESAPESGGVVQPLTAIGRFPAWDLQQLQTMVNKTIAYEEQTNCSWARRLISVAEWYESELDFWEYTARDFNIHQYPLFTDTVLFHERPLSLRQKHREDFRALWNQGAGMINFFGASNFWIFSRDTFFTTFDVDSLSNDTKLPLVTWLVSQRFEKSDTLPLAVNLLQSEGRGAVAALVCSGLTYASILSDYLMAFTNRLKASPHELIGKAMNFARTSSSLGSEARKHVLLGDPALELKNAKTIVGINSQINTIHKFELNQNYPNPFNPKTIISFNLQQAAYVQIRVYNTLGQEIAVLANNEYSAGPHNVEFDASRLELAGGVYFYRIDADGFVQTKKMLYIK
jgi:hypothetical protein